jgi:hypothetical protein
MGQTPQTSGTYPQRAPDLKDDAIGVCVRIPLGQARLQCEPFHSTRMQRGGARHARNKRDMGTPHSKRLLHRQCVGTLPMSRDLHL